MKILIFLLSFYLLIIPVFTSTGNRLRIVDLYSDILYIREMDAERYKPEELENIFEISHRIIEGFYYRLSDRRKTWFKAGVGSLALSVTGFSLSLINDVIGSKNTNIYETNRFITGTAIGVTILSLAMISLSDRN